MKNLGIILGISLLMSACVSDNPLADKKEELQAAKDELNASMAEVKALEIEVASLDTVEVMAAPINVSLQTMQFAPFTHFVGVEGIVEAEEDVMVSFQSQGEIMGIYVEEGDKVKKGQTLAKLNPGPVQNQLAELKTRWELANTLFLKQKRLWIEQNIGSEIQYLQANSNKEALERNMAAVRSQIAMSVITAPITGIVDRINYKKGAYASPQMPFAQIINLKNLYINADLSESYLPKVKAGDTVQVNFSTLGLQMDVPIYRLGNVINPQNRSFEVQLKMQNQNNVIKPNALASLTIRDFYKADALVLPSNVVQQDIDGAFVFVAVQDQNQWRAQKRYVETAMSNANNETLIRAGLTIGEKVITNGYNLITNETLVTELMDNNSAWK